MIILPPGHPSNLTYITGDKVTEASWYGFAYHLANYLHLPHPPTSNRRMQHGWYWWEPDEDELLSNYLTIDSENGILVQDRRFATHLRQLGFTSFATGLGFHIYKSYMNNSQYEFSRQGILYVPMHSISGADYANEILDEIREFADQVSRFSVLLSVHDLPLASEVSKYTDRIYVGAHSKEIRSLERIDFAFSSHEYVYSCHMGSHIFYSLICGTKTGIVNLRDFDNKFDLNLIATGRYGDVFKSKVNTTGYIRNKFPKLISEKNKPEFELGDLNYMLPVDPTLVATALGWNI